MCLHHRNSNHVSVSCQHKQMHMFILLQHLGVGTISSLSLSLSLSLSRSLFLSLSLQRARLAPTAPCAEVERERTSMEMLIRQILYRAWPVRGHGQGSLYLAAPKSHQQGVGREAWQGHAAELSWYNLPAIIPTLCPLPYSVSLTTLFILGFHMPCSILTRLHASFTMLPMMHIFVYLNVVKVGSKVKNQGQSLSLSDWLIFSEYAREWKRLVRYFVRGTCQVGWVTGTRHGTRARAHTHTHPRTRYVHQAIARRTSTRLSSGLTTHLRF